MTDQPPSPRKQIGKLIMASSAIGQAMDIPRRSLEAIRTSDLLVFEEDRPARRILKEAKVFRDYLNLTEHQEKNTIAEVSKALKNGKTVVYMSDQGTPVLADPGRQLLQLAYQIKAKIEVIPGPSSITAALSACPFSNERFLYVGFLPRDEKTRLEELERFKKTSEMLIILDTPYRLKAVLQTCGQVFSKKKKAFLALDISGENENYLLGFFAELNDLIDKESRLNFVLIVEGGRD